MENKNLSLGKVDLSDGIDKDNKQEGKRGEEVFDGGVMAAIDEPPSMGEVVQSILMAKLNTTENILKVGGLKFGVATFIWCLGYFGFSLLWIFCGVCLMMFISEKIRRKKVITEVLKHNADDPKKFMDTLRDIYRTNGRRLPSWITEAFYQIYFPDVEKAEWMNKIMSQMWPYVGGYVKKLFTEKVQKSIQESSGMLSGFRFTDVDLGDRAPRVAGVKVYSNALTRRNEIVMDLQIVYDSDSNIGVSVNRLRAGISDLKIRGLLRVELHPLLEEMPLIGAVSVAFVHRPSIDFDLTNLANLFDLPGFDGMLRGAVTDSICGIMVLPEKYILPMCANVDISRLRFPMPQGVIRIHIIEAKNLEEKDRKFLGRIGGGSDPYVVVKVGHTKKFQTKTIDHCVDPVWNESFDVAVTDVHSTSVHLSLFDDDGALNKADDLGSATIPIHTVYEHGVIDEWIKLSEATQGSIHVKIEWYSLSSDPHDLKQALEHSMNKHTSFSAMLNIYADGAQYLPDSEQDKFDPSPTLKINVVGLEKEAFKTQTILHTNHPVWEENFNILLTNPKSDQILFEVIDHRCYNSIENMLHPAATVRRALYKRRHHSKKSAVSVSDIDDGIEDKQQNGRLGVLKFPVESLLKCEGLCKEEPFSLKASGAKSVLNMRLTLMILVPKEKSGSSDALSHIRVIPTEKGDSNDSTPSSNASTPTKTVPELPENSLKDNSSVSSGNIDFEGNGNFHSPLSRESLSRTESSSSDISNVGAVLNLRSRLNAKNDVTAPTADKGNGLGRLQLTIQYIRSHLSVTVNRAEDLIVCDEDNNTSDPYVKVHIDSDPRHKKKTTVVKNNLNPEFKQSLLFDISLGEAKKNKLTAVVKNHSGFLSSEKVLMGNAYVDLSNFNLAQPTTNWYYLELPKDK